MIVYRYSSYKGLSRQFGYSYHGRVGNDSRIDVSLVRITLMYLIISPEFRFNYPYARSADQKQTNMQYPSVSHTPSRVSLPQLARHPATPGRIQATT
jgi:hypothetical protein